MTVQTSLKVDEHHSPGFEAADESLAQLFQSRGSKHSLHFFQQQIRSKAGKLVKGGDLLPSSNVMSERAGSLTNFGYLMYLSLIDVSYLRYYVTVDGI